MKVSFMTFACPQWTYDEVLACAVELGYDGVEPRMDSKHAHGIEVALDAAGRRTARAKAEDAGVALCCLATSLQFAKVAADARATLLDEAKARIELAADLGMGGLRVFAGQPPEGVALADALVACGENLAQAGEFAASAGVELWLETHDSVSKAENCAVAVNGANHPAVSFNYDVMHPLRNGESLDTTFAALGSKIRHCHWHDAINDPKKVAITKFGEGELPLVEILQRLKTLGFTGYLSGEWFNDQLGATPRESLEHYVTATRALMAEAGVA